jgi:hypothetical protein
MSWNGSPLRMPAARASGRSQASDRLSLQRSLRRSATVPLSVRAGSSLHGSASCHGSTQPEARLGFWVSASAVTCTSARYFIHGARAAVLRIKRDRAPIGAWLDRLDARAHKNIVIVAMANKIAEKNTFGLEALRAPTFPHHDDEQALHRSLHRVSKDERTVTTAYPQPGSDNGLQRPIGL